MKRADNTITEGEQSHILEEKQMVKGLAST